MANGNAASWKHLAESRGRKEVLSKYYGDKAIFAGVVHLYAEIHPKMNDLITEDAKIT
jgi:hypothetical protein